MSRKPRRKRSEKVLAKTCAECGKKDTTMKRCGNCTAVTYCGKECQKANWDLAHKPFCNPKPSLQLPTSGITELGKNTKYCITCWKIKSDLIPCPECEGVWYCDKQCEEADLKEHEVYCGDLKADESGDCKEKVLGLHECEKCGRKKAFEKCAKCYAVWYCGSVCQKEDWKKHKKVCDAIPGLVN